MLSAEVFFVGPFPAVVAPEPVLRRLADAFLQEGGILLGKAEVGILLGIVGHFDEAGVVVAAFYARHVYIVDQGVGAFGYALCTGEDGRLVVQEVCPEVYVVPVGRLVADEAYDEAFALHAVLD